MEYRGIQYAVVRTITKGWRWSVKRDHNDKVGTSLDRDNAILRAKRFIDELVKTRPSLMRESHGSERTAKGHPATHGIANRDHRGGALRGYRLRRRPGTHVSPQWLPSNWKVLPTKRPA